MSTPKTTYEVQGLHKLAEPDNFEHGCHGQTVATWIDVRFSAATVPELVEKLRDFLDVHPDAVTLDACEEPGRVDLQLLENDAGERPSREELAEWQADKRDLWAATYTGYAQRVTRETVPLLPLVEAGT